MINYIDGDVLTAKGTKETPVIIPHICNNKGGWGAGFVVPLALKWPITKENYQKLNDSYGYVLGETQMIKVEENIYVANMIAQNGYMSKDNPKPIHYPSLEECMNSVCNFAINHTDYICRICAPKFGSGLAGGDWSVIEGMIEKIWCNSNLDVTVYSLKE